MGDYKSVNGGSTDMSDFSTNSYANSLKEWHWKQSSSLSKSFEPDFLSSNESKIRAERIRARERRLAPYIQALTHARSDLAREHVFVFLSEAEGGSRILSLPAGARVSDALEEGEIFVNGSIADFSQELRNGDVVTSAKTTV